MATGTGTLERITDLDHGELCDCTWCMVTRMRRRERRDNADRRIAGFAAAVERRSGQDRRAS